MQSHTFVCIVDGDQRLSTRKKTFCTNTDDQIIALMIVILRCLDLYCVEMKYRLCRGYVLCQYNTDEVNVDMEI